MNETAKSSPVGLDLPKLQAWLAVHVPTLSADEGAHALYRITLGLVKKLVVADVLGAGLVDPVFADPSAYTSAECAVAAVAYSFELYFDFSGYSDMALGAAALFGFKLPENFARPYLARNLFEFWNRWHMSLSTWLRDYLYRPLGGSRVSRPRVLFNLMVVMVLGGLWHGAAWRFVAWGAVHGFYLMSERVIRKRFAPEHAEPRDRPVAAQEVEA